MRRHGVRRGPAPQSARTANLREDHDKFQGSPRIAWSPRSCTTSLCSFEFGCAVEVFGLPRPEFGDDWYQFVTCAAEPGPLRAVGGFRVTAQAGLDVLAQRRHDRHSGLEGR